ncbi:PQQ-like beta-propeller repeat protein [Cellulomonas fimi]|uniref:hypothetical protein n=1 Tax=Cellulomonas fimi TaxID=1708 RepID=UPI00234C27B8|nr:hypothetical protein [Cellulomonas fimi]MDC7121070.1 PQQ-like beta-propeller repeat protein [Cellulomonas fimi]
MAGRRSAARMQLVEVDESPAPQTRPEHPDNPASALAAPSAEPTVRTPFTRVARRWWPVAAVVVVAVVVTVGAAVARDRAFVERIAAVPGLVRPLDGEPAIRWSAPAAPHRGAVVAADGALVLVSAQDGRWLVTAHAADDGRSLWTRDLAPVQRSGFESSLVACPSRGEDVGSLVVCLVTEPRVVYSDDASIDEPAHTRVVTLDAASGEELGAWEVDDALVEAGRVGDDLVLVTLDDAGHAVAERRAVVGGGARWSYTTPDVLESITLSRVAGAKVARDVVVVEGVVTTVLDADDGAVLTAGAPYRNLQVAALRDGFATWATVGGGQVHDADGSQRFEVDGLPVPFSLDDGTAPDVLVVDDGSRLRGVDAATGRVRWSTETMLDVRARVSERLLVSGLSRFGVVDAADGRVRWVSDAGDPMPWAPLTDGALVLAPGLSPGGSAQLVGLGLDDGVRYWALDLPGRVQRVDGVGGVLVARTADQALVLG